MSRSFYYLREQKNKRIKNESYCGFSQVFLDFKFFVILEIYVSSDIGLGVGVVKSDFTGSNFF